MGSFYYPNPKTPELCRNLLLSALQYGLLVLPWWSYDLLQDQRFQEEFSKQIEEMESNSSANQPAYIKRKLDLINTEIQRLVDNPRTKKRKTIETNLTKPKTMDFNAIFSISTAKDFDTILGLSTRR